MAASSSDERTRSTQSRRRFFTRVSGATAAIIASGVGLNLRVLGQQSAQGQRVTMVAATLGQEMGLTTYRLTIRDDGRRHEVIADLLGPGGQSQGQWRRVRTYSAVIDPRLRRERRRTLNEEMRLTWLGETLEIDTDKQNGTFDTRYNGQSVGTVRPQVGTRSDAPPAIVNLLQQRPILFKLAGAIAQDVDSALAELRPLARLDDTNGLLTQSVAHAQCGDIQCYGSTVTDYSYDWLQTTACQEATQLVNNACTNQYCWGCCGVQTNHGCIWGDFYCWCYAVGVTCSCGG
jgi:hypothetical protein